jgi:hypothetical protein
LTTKAAYSIVLKPHKTCHAVFTLQPYGCSADGIGSWYRAHAADVLHTVHCALHCGKLVSSGFVSSLEVLACYIAAVVHDVEHPGKQLLACH